MGVSAVAGAVVGGLMQGRSASRAARANTRQQEAALAFQEKQIQRGEKIAKGAFKFGREAALAQAERASREADAALAARGYDPAGTIGLGAKRALMSEAAGGVQQLYQNIAQMRMANLQGQSFPMITQAGPQGNWAADAARLAMMSQAAGVPSTLPQGQMGETLYGPGYGTAVSAPPFAPTPPTTPGPYASGYEFGD